MPESNAPPEKAKTEKQLDKALADTFPASDPVALESNLITGRPVKKKPQDASEVDNPSDADKSDQHPDSKPS